MDSQISKSGWYQKRLAATAANILDFTIPQLIHNYARADGIEKKMPATATIILDFTSPQRIHK